MTSNGDAKWCLKNINEKLGQGRIVGTCETPPNGEYSYGLVIEHEDGQRFLAWIMCDPEGNGPGFLDIEERNK